MVTLRLSGPVLLVKRFCLEKTVNGRIFRVLQGLKFPPSPSNEIAGENNLKNCINHVHEI